MAGNRGGDRPSGDRRGSLSHAGDEDEAGEKEREPWYENRTRRAPRPWKIASSDTETPSVREYLQQQREAGMARRDLALTVAGVLLLVFLPAALVGSILTLMILSLVDNPLLWWVGLTVGVLLLMLVASEFT